MQGTGWLLVGSTAGLATALASPAWFPALEGLGMPAGWPRLGLALGWIAAGLALYFRSHWAAAAGALRRSAAERHDAAARLGRLADDLDRTAYVISDNLHEAEDPGRGSLFLDGARAHAAKLGDLASRLRGIASRVAPSAAPRQERGVGREPPVDGG